MIAFVPLVDSTQLALGFEPGVGFRLTTDSDTRDIPTDSLAELTVEASSEPHKAQPLQITDKIVTV